MYRRTPSTAASCRALAAPARRRGFTLVELLVVVGIIAVLVGVLLPMLGRARSMAREMSCAGNLKQIGGALTMYVTDHRGKIPLTRHDITTQPDQAWIYNLGAYLSQVDEVRACPEHHRYDDVIERRATSYVFNEYVAVPLLTPLGKVVEDYTNVMRLRNMSELPVLFELADTRNVTEYWDHIHSRWWFEAATGDERWDRMISEIEPQRHGRQSVDRREPAGRSNMLFADMHVSAVSGDELREHAEEGTPQRNFARPRRD